MTNYYFVLGLKENATASEIKAAFKRQAVKYHPDKNAGKPEMEEKFKEINQAYQILSDQYEKARYDLKLKYRAFSNSPRPAANNSSFRRKNSTYTPPSVDYRQNSIATLYAFGITFGIALIVMMGVWAKSTYDQMKLENLLAERRAVYNEAKGSFGSGDFESAFTLMSSLDFFRAEEQDMRFFKDNMVQDIILLGDENFQTEKYDKAIYLYELVEKFEPSKPFYELKLQLAEAYKKVNEPDKSIEVYEKLMVLDYKTIASMVEIAEIRRDFLKDVESAKEYYLNAHKRAVAQYKNFYGEAYSLVINERYVPEEHYDLYSGLADIYLRLDNPEMAIKAADWNKYVWPDSTHAYLISANAWLALKEQDKACEEFQEARNRGWEGRPFAACD